MQKPVFDHSGFPQTRWTLVQRAAADGDASALEALSSLCETYYGPVLVVIRSRGYQEHDAEDLRQRFFIHLMNREKFAKALDKQVKLRVFLLQELKGFLIDHYRHSTAAKRDGSRSVSMEETRSAGGIEPPELVEWETPEVEFDRSWRKALLGACMRSLEKLWEKRRSVSPDLPKFAEIAPFIGQSSDETQLKASERLGINVNTLKSHLRNLRGELGHLLHEHVAQTLVNPSREAVLEELAALRLVDS